MGKNKKGRKREVMGKCEMTRRRGEMGKKRKRKSREMGKKRKKKSSEMKGKWERKKKKKKRRENGEK